jgi:hypothetical protein
MRDTIMSKIYVSHSIRGKKGNTATQEQMAENCAKVRFFGKCLRLNISSRIEWYIPGEHDELISYLFHKGYVTEAAILEGDCDILSKCRGLILYMPDDYISKGMRIELDYANEHEIPVRFIDEQILSGHREWRIIKEFIEELEAVENV